VSTDFDEDAWRAELLEHREEKDEFFRSHRQSLVPAEARDEFDGIQYFDPNPDYRVEAAVEPAEGDDSLTMETTADTEQEYARVAELGVDLQGEEHSLVAYRSVDSPEDTLFVPFRDKTTGQETDGGGRYIEFEVGEASASDASLEGADPRAGGIHDAETVTLDFNLAYHPFCVFNDAFVCPLPPEENWLDTEIRAGECLPTDGTYDFAHGRSGEGHPH
jgi:uncharacterized protein (DUF1684 family)